MKLAAALTACSCRFMRPRALRSAAASGLAAFTVMTTGVPSALGQCESGWLPNPEQFGTDGTISAVTLWDPDGAGPLEPTLVAAGSFTMAGSTAASNIAAWDGNMWHPLGAGTNGTVLALAAVPGGGLFAAGSFTMAGEAQASRIARWNGSTWSALGQGMTSTVYVLAVLQNGDLVAGGGFTMAGGAPASRVARWNGATWSAMGSGMNVNLVDSMRVLTNGDLIAGGGFTMAGGVLANRIARWDGAAWSALDTGVGNGGVRCIAVLPGGNLAIGGWFTLAGGVPVPRIAQWNGSTWSALSAAGMESTVQTFATRPNGDLIAGGYFTTVGGSTANHIARWDGNAWSTLGTGTNGNVLSLAILPDGDLIAAGAFTEAGDLPALRVGRYRFGAPMPEISGQPSGSRVCPSGSAVFSVAMASSGPFSYQWQIETPPGVWRTFPGDPFPLPCGGTAGAEPQGAASVSIRISPCADDQSQPRSYQVRCVVSNACGSATSDEATYTICPADLDCDGSVAVPDIFAFLSAWFAQTPAADFDGNGLIQVPDIFAFLSAWFAGC